MTFNPNMTICLTPKERAKTHLFTCTPVMKTFMIPP